jgi:hypothetical protein
MTKTRDYKQGLIDARNVASKFMAKYEAEAKPDAARASRKIWHAINSLVAQEVDGPEQRDRDGVLMRDRDEFDDDAGLEAVMGPALKSNTAPHADDIAVGSFIEATQEIEALRARNDHLLRVIEHAKPYVDREVEEAKKRGALSMSDILVPEMIRAAIDPYRTI